MSLPCLQPFICFSLHFRKCKESLARSGLTSSPTWLPHWPLPALPQPQGLQWVWERPEILEHILLLLLSGKLWALLTLHTLNVTPERPQLFDCQLLPTSFLLSKSHNLQLHIYLLIIGLSTDCNLWKGREYIPMYT